MLVMVSHGFMRIDTGKKASTLNCVDCIDLMRIHLDLKCCRTKTDEHSLVWRLFLVSILGGPLPGTNIWMCVSNTAVRVAL